MRWRGLAALAVYAALPALPALSAACVLDLSNLSGGKPDAGAGGGGGASTSSATTSTTSATTSSGSTGGAPPALFHCDPCPNGGCAVTPLAMGADANEPMGIALEADTLYWVNQAGNSVMRLVASAGQPEKIADANMPVAVAVNGGFVVWAEQDGVHGCTAANCAASSILIAGSTLNGSIRGVAYDGQYVFYTDDGSDPMGGKVTRCPPQQGCPGQQNLGTNDAMPEGISYHNDQVFWTDAADGNQNGSINRASKGGGASSKVAASLDLPTSVVADDTYAYWTKNVASGGRIHRCPWATFCDTIDDLATGLAAPLDIALASGRVYWSNAGDGSIMSCLASGCGANPPVTLASGRQGLRRIAVGQSCVFFTSDDNGGSVSKVAR